MTINIDFSSADEGLILLEKLQRQEPVRSSEWRALYKTQGYKALLDNRIRTKGDIRGHFQKGVEGDLPGAAALRGDLEDFARRCEKAVAVLVPLLIKWLPEELTFEQPVIAVLLYGGTGEQTDPALLDLEHALALGEDELRKILLVGALTLLIRRYQNLERFYLRNFLPIRRYMNFIYALWDLQISGLTAFLEGGGEEGGTFLKEADELFCRAAAASRGDLEKLGREFRDLPGREEAGAWLCRTLASKGEDGEDDFLSRSLIRPTAPFILLRSREKTLSPEADFFIDTLDDLLS
ncbi:MAG: hypothetical protein JXA95_05610 [Spirochaetales bacterium]|nr:hypothetical protein [Spirochaetales bacterium]